MANKTFPGETYKQFTNSDVEYIAIRFSRGADGQPKIGDPLAVGGQLFLYNSDGNFVRMVGVNIDATKLSAAKKAILTGLRDDLVVYANAKLAAATKPSEV